MATALLEELGGSDVRLRDEAWRYSKAALRVLSQQEFVPADGGAGVPAALLERLEPGARLVFVNGAFHAALSDTAVSSAVAITHAGPSSCQLTISGDFDLPLHVVYLSVPSPSPSRWSSDLVIKLRAGKARVIEHHLGEAGADVLGATNVSVDIARGAGLQIATLADLPDSVSLFRRHLANVEGDDAGLDATHVLLGGRLQRHEIGVELTGRQARYDSRGVFALQGRQHADVRFDVRHAARDTASKIVWRGVADQRARGIFHGAITVAAGADGSDANLSNKNLLLSPHAEIDTQPVLEIHADEVKAAHGATVGQLDEHALFYLRSRGLPLDAARRLLIGAFAAAALADISPASLRESLETVLASRLPRSGKA